jgi:signal transduction histidine kinase
VSPARPTVAKVLLVDDLEENLFAFEALLEGPGLALLKAGSGVAALELMLSHEVALALIDVQMPEMDGVALAELMRGSERTKHIPIILMTAGSRDPQRVFRGYEAGAVDFLFKPIEPAVLLNKVGTFVQLYRQRLELEQTLRLNEMFMAVLGHDLRNPVGAVVTTAALLEATQDPAVVRKSAERLRSIGTRMGRMITDLLDLARARLGGGIPVTPRPTDFSALVHRVVDELRLVHEGRELVLRIPEPTAGHVVGKWDADRLSQLVENLVINAIEHGPREHPVVVTLSRTLTSAILSVANHGQIPPELLGQLFDPFRSGAERRETAAGGGLGLGLYIVRQIAVAHGGTVSASSEAGTVTFTAQLPLARELAVSPG